MDIKVAQLVNQIIMNTSNRDLTQVLLQSVKLNVNDKMDSDFLLDGGAVASFIPLHVVKLLGKEADIHGKNKTLRYAGGDIDVLRGIVKFELKFEDAVTVVHTFCVTENPSTPLILGMDFALGSNCLSNPHKQTLTFFHENGNTIINTRADTSISFDLEDPDRMIIPVSVARNKNNKEVQDISINYEYEFTHGDVQLWININENQTVWSEDMVIQPARALFYKLGLYLVPTVLQQGNKDGPHGILIVNMTQRDVVLKQNNMLGQLFTPSSAPKSVQFVTSMDQIMDVVT